MKHWILLVCFIFCNSAYAMNGGNHASVSQFPSSLEIDIPTGGHPRFLACTGTKISDRFVLTAAHCFMSGLPRDRSGTLSESTLKIKTKIHFVQYASKKISDQRLVTTVFYNLSLDLALIDIQENRPENANGLLEHTPSAIISFEPLQEGQEIFIGGYGSQDQRLKMSNSLFTLHGPAMQNLKEHPQILQADKNFTLPERISQVHVIGIATISLKDSNGSGRLSSGDSGGGVYSGDGITRSLVGIGNGGVDTCADGSRDCSEDDIFIRLASPNVRQWIQAALSSS